VQQNWFFFLEFLKSFTKRKEKKRKTNPPRPGYRPTRGARPWAQVGQDPHARAASKGPGGPKLTSPRHLQEDPMAREQGAGARRPFPCPSRARRRAAVAATGQGGRDRGARGESAGNERERATAGEDRPHPAVRSGARAHAGRAQNPHRNGAQQPAWASVTCARQKAAAGQQGVALWDPPHFRKEKTFLTRFTPPQSSPNFDCVRLLVTRD